MCSRKPETETWAFQYEVGKPAKITNISFGISRGFHRSQEKVRTLERVTRNTLLGVNKTFSSVWSGRSSTNLFGRIKHNYCLISQESFLFSDIKLKEIEFQILLAFISEKKVLQYFIHLEFRMRSRNALFWLQISTMSKSCKNANESCTKFYKILD